MIKKEEFKKFIQTGKIDQRLGARSIPQNAKNYLNKHKTTISGWKNKPYFIRDNFDDDFNLQKKVLDG